MADPFQLGATVLGDSADLGDAVADVADPGLGLLGSALGGLMGLFGGGSNQSQNQNQNQNQSQSQSSTSSANSNSNSSAYNNLTINYPNESAGMALQGLLGSQGPVQQVGAPNSLQSPSAGLASLPGFQSPGLLATGLGGSPVPEQAQAVSAGSPVYGGGASTPQVAPQGQFAFPASPSGGIMDPVAAATAALLGAPQGGIQSPLLQGSAFVNQPGTNQPALLASAGGGASPFMPPTTSDASGSILPGLANDLPAAAPQRSDSLPSQFSQPQMEELRAPQMSLSDYQLSRRDKRSPGDKNKPARGGEPGQVDAQLPLDVRKQLQTALDAYDKAGEMVASDASKFPAGADQNGQPISHRERQKVLEGRISETEDRMKQARDYSAEVTKHLKDVVMVGEGGSDTEPLSLVNQADRMIEEQRGRVGSYLARGLAGYSPANDRGLNQRLYENRDLTSKVLNFLNPGRHANIVHYAQAQTAMLNEQFEKNMPLAQKQLEAQVSGLDKGLQHEIMASRTLLANDRSELNADKRAELAQATQLRTNAHQDIIKQLTLASQDQDREQRMRIAKMVDSRMRAFHADTVRYQNAMVGLQQEARDIGAMNADVNATLAPYQAYRDISGGENFDPSKPPPLPNLAVGQRAQQILHGVSPTAPPAAHAAAKQFNDALNSLVQSGQMTKPQAYAAFQAMKAKMGW